MGEVHGVKAAPSRLQLKVPVVSVLVKLKLAVVLFVRATGPDVIAVSGGVLSNVTLTEEEAEFEDPSHALTVIVAAPSGREAEFQSKP